MGWIQTYTKKKFDLLDPKPEMVCIEDVAHHLSNVCRFSGACSEFYSVAQHSVLVSEVCSPDSAVWGLLHDAGEAYYGDIVTPIWGSLKEIGKEPSIIIDIKIREVVTLL